MKLVADTSAWIASLEGDHVMGQALLDNHLVLITDVVCAELLSAPRPDRQQRLVERLARGDRILNLAGLADMQRAAWCMRASREAGRTVRSIADCLIAAVCIREGLPLLHNDRDFDTLAELTELQVVTP